MKAIYLWVIQLWGTHFCFVFVLILRLPSEPRFSTFGFWLPTHDFCLLHTASYSSITSFPRSYWNYYAAFTMLYYIFPATDINGFHHWCPEIRSEHVSPRTSSQTRIWTAPFPSFGRGHTHLRCHHARDLDCGPRKVFCARFLPYCKLRTSPSKLLSQTKSKRNFTGAGLVDISKTNQDWLESATHASDKLLMI